MNDLRHDAYREAKIPFSAIDADNVKLGHALRESANDGAPAYIRMPELDKRLSRGDISNSNAWYESATGRTRYFCVLYAADEQRWLPIVERSEVTR